MRRASCVLAFVLMAGSAWAQTPAPDGAALYSQYCGRCHDGGTPRTPPRRALAVMAPERIVGALETGSMRTQGAARTPEERRAIAAFLSGKAIGETPAPPPLKTCDAPGRTAAHPASWNGWGVSLANDRFQRAAGFGASDVPKLKLKWAFAFSGDASAAVQPTIAGGRIYVASAPGRIYALDLRSGCAYWTFDADAQVRTAIDVATVAGSRIAVFGDVAGNVYSVDADTGQLRWKKKVEAHPVARITGTPRVYGGRVFATVSSIEEVIGANPQYSCCTFRGSVVALDVATGDVAWKTYVIPDEPKPTRKNSAGTQLFGPSGAAIWSTPTIDEKTGSLYIATGDSYSDPPADTSDAIMALDLKSGAIKWSRQMTAGDAYNLGCGATAGPNCPDAKGPDVDFGSPPILVSLSGGKRALVIGQKSGVVHALDPDDRGKVLWTTRIGKGGVLGGIEWGSASDGKNIYAPLSDLTFAQRAGEVMGQSLDPAAGGGLFALRLTDGKEVWHAAPAASCGDRRNCSPAQSAPASIGGGVVFSGSIDGHLRAYALASGDVVWDFDAVRTFDTVNGTKARGGSFDVGGPAIADGMIVATSGYSQWGGAPGNVLLAFAVDGK
ncbi:MAG TPA: PQQ-binding-like beta-propeller repeat protein [Vicinamibacterales bacterium]|nr:PQQ-binding-like beta-propeller repeat protein [Vicinamibacterales bacterium]